MKKLDYLIKENVNAYVNKIINEVEGNYETLTGYEASPLEDFKNTILCTTVSIDGPKGGVEIDGEHYGFYMEYTASTEAYEEYDAGDYFTPPSSYMHNDDSFSIDEAIISYYGNDTDESGEIEATPELLEFITKHADFSGWELEPYDDWNDDSYDEYKDAQWEREMGD